jgi:hypothetical protein
METTPLNAISVVIAVAGLLLGVLGSALGLIGRWRHQALEQRLIEIEEARKRELARQAKRASLRAAIEERVQARWFVTIQNHGHGDAEDLTVSINGSPLDHCELIDPKELNPARIDTVAAHGGLRIPLRVAHRPQELEVELTWSDASGELGFYQAKLTG